MPLTPAELESAAQALFDAERDRSYIAPVTETFPGCDITDAYAIGQQVAARKRAAGRRVRGHKIGLTSEVMREVSGANEPDYGTIFDDQVLPEDQEVPLGRFNRPFVEIELAFLMKSGLSGPGLDVADVIQAVEYAVPAIEIVDQRYTHAGPGPVVVDSIADGAWCGAIVLGGNPRRLDQFDVRNVKGSLLINDEKRAEGSTAAVMGNPLNAVAWLANKLSEFGEQLEPGHLVMSGSFIRLARLRPGDTVRASYDVFGDVAFTLSS